MNTDIQRLGVMLGSMRDVRKIVQGAITELAKVQTIVSEKENSLMIQLAEKRHEAQAPEEPILWGLIIRSGVVFTRNRRGWHGSAMELRDLLLGADSKLTAKEKKTVPLPAWIGRQLEECRRRFGDECCSMKRERLRHVWILQQCTVGIIPG